MVADSPSATDPYLRPEHKYLNGPVITRPGEAREFKGGRLVVQRLPRSCEDPLQLTRLCGVVCAGCGYALGEAAALKCDRCHRTFHGDGADVDVAERCFGNARGNDADGNRICGLCVPLGAGEDARFTQAKLVRDFELWGYQTQIPRMHDRTPFACLPVTIRCA